MHLLNSDISKIKAVNAFDYYALSFIFNDGFTAYMLQLLLMLPMIVTACERSITFLKDKIVDPHASLIWDEAEHSNISNISKCLYIVLFI